MFKNQEEEGEGDPHTDLQMFVLKIHVLETRGGGGGGDGGKMKEVLQSSADDGDGPAADCKGHADGDGDEDARIEGETNTLFVAETTCGITHLFRNVSASPHSVGLLPVGISPSPDSILLSFLLGFLASM